VAAALLSILTPTLPERRESLCRLADVLRPQIQAAEGAVAVLTLEDCGERPTGEKRQRLLEQARTPYVAFVDDDDLVSSDYVPRILDALADGPDVVGFRLRRFVDGALEGYAVHSLSAGRWHTERGEGLTLYERTPNHLNPIRRELALSVGYRPMSVGEDADYSNRLYALHGKTMREAFVDAYLYDYLSTSRPPVPVKEWDDAGRLTRAGAALAIRAGGSAHYGGRVCRTLGELEAV
jgi:hypothetical protein